MRDASSVVVDGARLVWRHLPVLLVLFLLGAAVRGGVIWLAVEVSDEHPLLAQLILPLAPIGTLAAIIFMLRTLSPSLRHASFDAADSSPAEQSDGGTRSRGRRLGLLRSRGAVAAVVDPVRLGGAGLERGLELLDVA